MKKLIALISLLFVVGNIFAGDIVVNGSVCDMTKGDAIIGAQIMVKNTNIAAVSDINGKFSVKVPDSAKTLEISFVGFYTKEVAIEPRLTVYLEEIPETQSPQKELTLDELRKKYCKENIRKHLKQFDEESAFFLIAYPFYYLNTFDIKIEDAERLLSSSGYFSAVGRGTGNNNQLVAIEKELIPYGNIPLNKKTTITATFENDRIKVCGYMFGYENISKAKKAMRKFKKEITEWTKDKPSQFLDQTIYEIPFKDRTYYVSIYVGEYLGRGYLNVDVSVVKK